MHGSVDIGGKHVRFGFSSVQDWLDSVILSFPAPWKVDGNEGKHYGTEILDGSGKHILSIWLAFGEPSAREKGDMTDEEWSEYCCDSHWESESAFHLAETIVATRNHIATCRYTPDERAMSILRSLVCEYGDWADRVWRAVSAGGPERRMLPDDPAIPQIGHHKWNPDR